MWVCGAGTRASLSPGSTSTEDEDEDEAFQLPQLFDFDDLLEFDDLDGTHALMVRVPGGWQGGAERKSTKIQLGDLRELLSLCRPQFPHL